MPPASGLGVEDATGGGAGRAGGSFFDARSAFFPRPGFVFLSFDYNQVEVRLLAHIAGEAHCRKYK